MLALIFEGVLIMGYFLYKREHLIEFLHFSNEQKSLKRKFPQSTFAFSITVFPTDSEIFHIDPDQIPKYAGKTPSFSKF